MAPDRPVIQPPLDPARLEWHAMDGPFPVPVECGTICVGGRHTHAAVAAYRDTPTRVCTLIDWPLGLGKPTVRQIEAVAAAKDASDAVEVAAHPPLIAGAESEALHGDLLGIVVAVREVSASVAVQVVIEAMSLMHNPKLIEAACLAVREAGGDGIVLGTGHGGAVSDTSIRTAIEAADGLPVKAWAGNDAALAGRLLDAGADTVGMVHG